jgi:hypothetical protein
MKRLKRILTIILALTIIFTISIGASQLQENITALQDRGVRVMIDGANLDLGDTPAIMYNKTTYLPVRKIAESIGKPVNWDNDTRTVYLGATTKKVKFDMNMLNSHNGINYTKQKDKLTLGDYSVSEGVWFSWSQDRMILRLDNKYTKLVFTIISENEEAPDISVEKIKYENSFQKVIEQLMTDTLKSGIDSKTYEVDVSDCELIRIKYDKNNLKSYEDIKKIIGDMYFQ